MNCRPKAYESSALPLSYSGVRFERMLRKEEFASMSSLGGALFRKTGFGGDFAVPAFFSCLQFYFSMLRQLKPAGGGELMGKFVHGDVVLVRLILCSMAEPGMLRARCLRLRKWFRLLR